MTPRVVIYPCSVIPSLPVPSSSVELATNNSQPENASLVQPCFRFDFSICHSKGVVLNSLSPGCVSVGKILVVTCVMISSLRLYLAQALSAVSFAPHSIPVFGYERKQSGCEGYDHEAKNVVARKMLAFLRQGVFGAVSDSALSFTYLSRGHSEPDVIALDEPCSTMKAARSEQRTA